MADEPKEPSEVAPLPTPSRGVPIVLDRERFLRYSLATVRKIRQELGPKALTDGVSEEKLAQLMLYGLLDDDPELTVEQLEATVDLENLPRVVDAIMQALGSKGKKLRVDVDTAGPQQPAPAPASDEAAPSQ